MQLKHTFANQKEMVEIEGANSYRLLRIYDVESSASVSRDKASLLSEILITKTL